MKIALPVHHFPPRYSAGAELYTLRLARWLLRAGHQPEVISFEQVGRGEPRAVVAEADSYQGVPVQRLRMDLYGSDRDYLFDNRPLGEWFAGYLERARPDLVHFQAGYLIGAAPLRAARSAGLPIALTLHDYWYICPRITLQRGDGSLCAQVPEQASACAWCDQLMRRSARAGERLTAGALGALAQRVALHDERAWVERRRSTLAAALAIPDAVLAPSQFLADMVRAHVPEGRLRVQRLGIDVAALVGAARAERCAALRVGYTGQIAAHKGVHLLVEAARRLLDQGVALELHIHGGLEANPAYAERLRRLAGGHPQIVLHGRYEHAQLPTILAGVDVAVTPSTWYENSPLAILEAHAAGVPVLAAAAGGMAELVRHEVDGLHFALGSSESLAAGLLRLSREPGLLERLRAGVRPPRSIDDEMSEMLALYGALAERRAADVGRA